MIFNGALLDKMSPTERAIMGKFDRAFKGDNMLANEYVRFGRSGKYIYEFAHGTMLKMHVYGVTVLTAAGAKTDLGQCFVDPDRQVAYQQAEAYIKELGDIQ